MTNYFSLQAFFQRGIYISSERTWFRSNVCRKRSFCYLLYFFATFDVASQANLTPLDAFTRAHPEVRVIAVAVQRDARMLLDAWVNALRPSFETTFDPDNAISEGTTALGQLA